MFQKRLPMRAACQMARQKTRNICCSTCSNLAVLCWDWVAKIWKTVFRVTVEWLNEPDTSQGGTGPSQLTWAVAKVRHQCQYLEHPQMDGKHTGPTVSRREAECGRDEEFRKAIACWERCGQERWVLSKERIMKVRSSTRGSREFCLDYFNILDLSMLSW